MKKYSFKKNNLAIIPPEIITQIISFLGVILLEPLWMLNKSILKYSKCYRTFIFGFDDFKKYNHNDYIFGNSEYSLSYRHKIEGYFFTKSLMKGINVAKRFSDIIKDRRSFYNEKFMELENNYDKVCEDIKNHLIKEKMNEENMIEEDGLEKNPEIHIESYEIGTIYMHKSVPLKDRILFYDMFNMNISFKNFKKCEQNLGTTYFGDCNSWDSYGDIYFKELAMICFLIRLFKLKDEKINKIFEKFRHSSLSPFAYFVNDDDNYSFKEYPAFQKYIKNLKTKVTQFGGEYIKNVLVLIQP